MNLKTAVQILLFVRCFCHLHFFLFVRSYGPLYCDVCMRWLMCVLLMAAVSRPPSLSISRSLSVSQQHLFFHRFSIVHIFMMLFVLFCSLTHSRFSFSICCFCITIYMYHRRESISTFIYPFFFLLSDVFCGFRYVPGLHI